jgi:cytoskeleton protein RodZ
MTEAQDKKKKSGGKPRRMRTADQFSTAAAETPAPVEEAAASPGAQKGEHVGTTLRRTREDMGYSLQDISSAINIRVAQLRAIEEGRVDALPGMTYAAGFVRSYANALKLDGNAMAERFKAEQGAPARAALRFPEPIVEDKLPSPIILGVTAVAALAIFLAWSIYSAGEWGHGAKDGAIPPAPVVGTASGEPTVSDQPLQSVPAPEAAAGAPAADAATAPEAADLTEQNVTAEVMGAKPDAAPVTPPAAAPAEDTTQAAETGTAPAPDAQADVTVAPETAATAEAAAQTPADEQINVRAGSVVLQARQQAWVQVSDGSGKVIYKKVMNKGDKYVVPDNRGATLVTSNAGGLDIFVEGKKVQAVGMGGEIVRGVSLAPDELKKKRNTYRYRRDY